MKPGERVGKLVDWLNQMCADLGLASDDDPFEDGDPLADELEDPGQKRVEW